MDLINPWAWDIILDYLRDLVLCSYLEHILDYLQDRKLRPHLQDYRARPQQNLGQPEDTEPTSYLVKPMHENYHTTQIFFNPIRKIVTQYFLKDFNAFLRKLNTNKQTDKPNNV